MGKNRWTRPTFRLQKEIFPWFFLPLFFRRLDGSNRRYTGCPFHRGDTRCRLAESFRGYKINLACKTEMGPWKRSGNRWRKGRTAQGGERERERRGEEKRRRLEEEKEGEPRLNPILLAPSFIPDHRRFFYAPLFIHTRVCTRAFDTWYNIPSIYAVTNRSLTRPLGKLWHYKRRTQLNW